MPNATIDFDQLALHFKNGLKSITDLNDYRADRESVRKNIWAIRRNPDAAIAQIDTVALDLVDKSIEEVNPDFRQLGDLFRQEIVAWTQLKGEIQKRSSDDVISGFLTLLERILKDEATLVPENSAANTVNLFLKKMRVMKAARVFKGAAKNVG